MMDTFDISVTDAAARLGKNKQHVFKVLGRLGIENRLERSAAARGQKIAYISAADFEKIREYFETFTDEDVPALVDSSAKGVFYLIQLEPEHDPSRFKLGFATNIEERVRSHRTAAPFSKLIRSWPCKLLWEKTAIESVAYGCKKIHTEVFRGENIESVLARCEKFFAIMPPIDDGRL